MGAFITTWAQQAVHGKSHGARVHCATNCPCGADAFHTGAWHQCARAKDVEHFHHVIRNFVNETNRFDIRLGEDTDDEEATLAVVSLISEILQKFRFRDAMLGMLVAVENINVDEVTIVHARQAAKVDGDESRAAGPWTSLQCNLCTRRMGRWRRSKLDCTDIHRWRGWQGCELVEEWWPDRRRRPRERWKGCKNKVCWNCLQTGHIAPSAKGDFNRSLSTVHVDDFDL